MALGDSGRNNKIILIVVLIAVLGIFGLSFLSDESDRDNSDSIIRYNYEITLAKNFFISQSQYYAAGIGNNYAIVEYAVVNDSYEEGVMTGISTSAMTLIADNVTYWHIPETICHPKYNNVKVGIGGKTNSVRVFEIPDSVAIEDISLDVRYFHEYSTPDPAVMRDVSIIV